jgi:hypothetical protein
MGEVLTVSRLKGFAVFGGRRPERVLRCCPWGQRKVEGSCINVVTY